VAEELRRLDTTVETTYAGSIDHDHAREPDHQGVGGPSVARERGDSHERS
jgi:hypothetical protein